MRHAYLKWEGIYSNIKFHFLPVFTIAPLSFCFWLLQESCHVTHYQWILARSILTVTVAFCRKLQQKTRHIHQFEKVYGMRTIITIVKADYCFMCQLLLNMLSNVTLPPYPSFFVHFKHTFVTNPTKISHFSITVTPPPRDTACHPPPKKNSERAPEVVHVTKIILYLSNTYTCFSFLTSGPFCQLKISSITPSWWPSTFNPVHPFP